MYLGWSDLVIKGRIRLSGEITEPTSEISPLSKDRGVYELTQLFNRDWHSYEQIPPRL